MTRHFERLVALGAMLVAGALFWQAQDLPFTDFMGPGPGLFPQVVAGFTCVMAALLVVFPGPPAQPREGDPGHAPAGTAERRTFLAYALALPFLAIGSAFLGFLATSLALALALTWFAEGRPLRVALLFGLSCGLVGIFIFGEMLEVTLPLSEIDRSLLRLAR
ncbi:MAG: tripartite tricarboxylate transporter TctB family protein [Alphaproteobacteria bacterium]|nr:tripartite tricarboxylate transporter TctB family protein [Alphaproteobacteria bacterium]